MSTDRSYNLSPRDETGWVFGLSIGQLSVIALGIIVGSLAVRVSPLAGLAAIVVAAVLAFGRLNGMPILDVLPVGITWISDFKNRREQWCVRLPVLTEPTRKGAGRALDDQEVLLLDGSRYGLGGEGSQIVVGHDKATDSYAVTMRVMGREFGLLDRSAQDGAVLSWANALQGFVSDRCPVASVRWSEWCAPAGLAEHRQWLQDHITDNPLDSVHNAYERLLQESGSLTTRHEALLTITVDAATSKVRSKGANRPQAVVEALLTEARLFRSRLEGAGLTVGNPLTTQEWARAMRLRIDPSSRTQLDTRSRSFGSSAGAISPTNAGPSSSASHWTYWQADGALHRSFYVSEWPRTEVMADWMGPLMLYNGCVRTISVFYEPIPRFMSYRSIRREATKIESDTESRTGRGLRVGAKYGRSRQAVDDREGELVAGYGEFAYVGVITVSAPDEEELDVVSDEITQVAASVGLEIRPLHGRHAEAFCTTLPLARTVARRRIL